MCVTLTHWLLGRSLSKSTSITSKLEGPRRSGENAATAKTNYVFKLVESQHSGGRLEISRIHLDTVAAGHHNEQIPVGLTHRES